VNLAGLDRSEVARGDVLARPGTLRASSLLDVVVSLLAEARPLADGTRVRVHVASAERLGRVRLLGAREIAGGGNAVAQIRLEKPAVAGRGDRLVLRSYSPATTIGGARVLDPLPPKRRAADRATLERLRDAVDPAAAAAVLVEDAGARGVDAAALAARLTVPSASLPALLDGATGLVGLGSEPTTWLSSAALARLSAGATAEVARFHRENPLKAAQPLEELRARVFARSPAGAVDFVLDGLVRSGTLVRHADAVAARGHAVTLSPREGEARRRLLEAAEKAGLAGVELAVLAPDVGIERPLLERVARVLQDERVLVRVGETLLVSRERLERLKADVRARHPPGSRLDVAAFKDLTGLSRKYAIPLLEFLDRERVTRRAGADRTVVG
jgi:selenocysteine-specific elongation factor